MSARRYSSGSSPAPQGARRISDNGTEILSDNEFDDVSDVTTAAWGARTASKPKAKAKAKPKPKPKPKAKAKAKGKGKAKAKAKAKSKSKAKAKAKAKGRAGIGTQKTQPKSNGAVVAVDDGCSPPVTDFILNKFEAVAASTSLGGRSDIPSTRATHLEDPYAASSFVQTATAPARRRTTLKGYTMADLAKPRPGTSDRHVSLADLGRLFHTAAGDTHAHANITSSASSSHPTPSAPATTGLYSHPPRPAPPSGNGHANITSSGSSSHPTPSAPATTGLYSHPPRPAPPSGNGHANITSSGSSSHPTPSAPATTGLYSHPPRPAPPSGNGHANITSSGSSSHPTPSAPATTGLYSHPPRPAPPSGNGHANITSSASSSHPTPSAPATTGLYSHLWRPAPPSGNGHSNITSSASSSHPTPSAPATTTLYSHPPRPAPPSGNGHSNITSSASSSHPTPSAPATTGLYSHPPRPAPPSGNGHANITSSASSSHPTPSAPATTGLYSHPPRPAPPSGNGHANITSSASSSHPTPSAPATTGLYSNPPRPAPPSGNGHANITSSGSSSHPTPSAPATTGLYSHPPRPAPPSGNGHANITSSASSSHPTPSAPATTGLYSHPPRPAPPSGNGHANITSSASSSHPTPSAPATTGLYSHPPRPAPPSGNGHSNITSSASSSHPTPSAPATTGLYSHPPRPAPPSGNGHANITSSASSSHPSPSAPATTGLYSHPWRPAPPSGNPSAPSGIVARKADQRDLPEEDIPQETLEFLHSLTDTDLDAISTFVIQPEHEIHPQGPREAAEADCENGASSGASRGDSVMFEGFPLIHNVLEAQRVSAEESEDEDDTDSGSSVDGSRARHRGPGLKWVKIMEFDDEDEAEAWINQGLKFCVQRRNYTKKYGFKHYYYCMQCGKAAVHAEKSRNSTSTGGPPIGVQVVLHYLNSTRQVVAYMNESNGQVAIHDHTEYEAKQRGLRDEVKSFVMQELHAGVISPKLAYEKLLQQISNGLLHPTCKPKSFEQFDNHFRYKKTQLNGGSGPITVRDIEMMARDHAEIPPETDMDKAYVVHSNFSGSSAFQVVFSTRRLIAATRTAPMISTDATYKLNYHSFPVLPLAIVDYRNHVFPVALAICGNEKTADFAELFRSLNVAAQKINLPPHSPEYIMADGAMQITNAAKLVYPRAKRCMCWFHVKKNVEDALQRLVVDEKLRWRMLRDLAYVQLAITKQAFKASFALYKDEYDSVAHEAVEYIRTSWVEHQYHSTWYEGHAPRLPSTNNGLESMNNQLKLTIHREKLPLGAFIAVVTGKIIPGYSDALAQNPSEADRAFETAEDVKATKKTFKIAALWQASTKIHEVSGPGLAGKFLFVLSRAADEDYLTSENVGRYLATISGTYRHPCFASVAAIMSKMYMITVPTGATNWRSLQCSCREYLKKKVCLHSIGIGIRLGLLNSEDEKMLPIQKSAPKRGRKRKAGPALAKSLTLDAAAQDRFLSF